ncbi:PilT domain-containing protein [Cutibacterium avidum]|nr:PilT domain-containing protein [Cutibacterium avidum]MBS6259884.1 twitching motility protein PilT [Propionibacterium sp.]AGJ78453.1 PilT domain-containing protein [Cutibacterium avidum 44067]ERF57347.1 PilT domain-containing protein [Cutibacterium avidum TM16]MCO6632800.1 twitching motility protein PilT [Cutibacterium avidum]MCO6657089.1 twitching motility protein PilT [Cutibacterium avidum]
MACTIAREQRLRGYDSVHCAAALSVCEDDSVAVPGDRALLTAWHDLGLNTVDTAL